jgi:hypothetical protein
MTTAAITIPAELGAALGYMQRVVACPEEIRARIAALRVPVDEAPPGRMTTSWRVGGGGGGRDSGRAFGGAGAGGRDHYRPGGGGDRRPYHGGGGGGGGTGGSRDAGHHFRSGGTWVSRHDASSGGGPSGGGGPRVPPRFGNRARKDVTTEERMLDRIRDKLNKFSEMTYDTTKGWLSELLDSGETGFLTDFITLVFEKAAVEKPFCALYARLLTELRAGFPHLATELTRIFGNFMTIFEEVADEPAVGSAQYDAFVAQRERRKFRRGYASFIGEVSRLGAVPAADLLRTCTVILAGFEDAKMREGQQLLCEEYADCLTTLVKSAPPAAMMSLKERIQANIASESTSLSMSKKAKFSLMGATDYLR